MKILAKIVVQVVERDNQGSSPYRDVWLRHANGASTDADGCVGLIRQEGGKWREHSDRPAQLFSTPEAAALALAGDFVQATGETFCGDVQAP